MQKEISICSQLSEGLAESRLLRLEVNQSAHDNPASTLPSASYNLTQVLETLLEVPGTIPNVRQTVAVAEWLKGSSSLFAPCYRLVRVHPETLGEVVPNCGGRSFFRGIS